MLDDLMTSDDMRMLVDIGFIALSAGLNKEARSIFAGVTAARPAQEAGPLGAAMVDLAENHVDAAVDLLRKLPPSDAALTYLGLALLRRGDVQEARWILDGVVATASDAAFSRLANEILAC